MAHVSSVKTVFPAPVKSSLWAVKGPSLFLICKNPLQHLLVRTFSAAASSCRLLAVKRCCSLRRASTLSRLLLFFFFFQLTTRFVPLRFFVPLCSRRATRKACVAVEPPYLRLTSPAPSSPSALPPPDPRPLTVRSSGEAHSAQCPQRWRPPRPSLPMPRQRPRTPAALVPPPPHPRCRSRKRRRRVSDGASPDPATTKK